MFHMLETLSRAVCYPALLLIPYTLCGCGNAEPIVETSPDIESAAGEPSTSNKAAADLASAERPSAPESADSPEHHYFHQSEQPHAAEWGYESDRGPAHWGDLSPDYILAKDGRRQSPIDIATTTDQVLPQIKFSYQSCGVDLVYNGHTVQESEDGASHIVVDDTEWELKQFHFHSPSEHTIDGRHFDMEMHLVHKSEDGHVAVVGVLIQEGEENSAFAELWQYLPTPDNKERVADVSINADTLLPKTRNYHRYSGSFTTPPCTEDVLWLVLTSPVEIAGSQIDAFRQVIHNNNRPIQPLNGRDILTKAAD